jgi:hypothetical protein
VPSKPRVRVNTHVVSSAPTAAPSVLKPYSAPTTPAALSTRRVIARASSGSDIPMKNVGQRRLTKSTTASNAGDAAR